MSDRTVIIRFITQMIAPCARSQFTVNCCPGLPSRQMLTRNQGVIYLEVPIGYARRLKFLTPSSTLACNPRHLLHELTHKLGGAFLPPSITYVKHKSGARPQQAASEPEMTVLMSIASSASLLASLPFGSLPRYGRLSTTLGLSFIEAHPDGSEIFRHFVIDICRCQPDWTSEQSFRNTASPTGRQTVLSDQRRVDRPSPPPRQHAWRPCRMRLTTLADA